MTREELKAINGMTDAQIDAVMAIHGKDASAANTAQQALQTQVQGLQQQLTTAQQGLKAFEGVDVNQLRGQITQLQGQLTQQAAQFQFNATMRNAARAAGAQSDDDVIALLPNKDTLQASQNQAADVAAAINALKTSKPYLFATQGNAGEGTPPAGTGTPPAGTGTPIVVPKPRTPAGSDPKLQDFVAMTGIQRMELKAKNPALFAVLMKDLREHR